MDEAREVPSLTPTKLAAAMAVDPKTVTRWARAGEIRFAITPGGHHRFYPSDLEAMLAGQLPQRAPLV
jgi:excisionase family DNA binding protein